jgi:phage tail-like protein
MPLFEYPLPGFHFLVVFQLFPQTPIDVMFQEVSGLSVTMNTESVTEGGQNRYVHKLPTRPNYSDITLKRGLFMSSLLVEWVRKGIEDYDFEPVNVLITLLNDMHIPVFGWHVINAIPVKWEVSSLNAESSQLVIESMTLSYRYFNMLTPASILGNITAGFSVSASLSI